MTIEENLYNAALALPEDFRRKLRNYFNKSLGSVDWKLQEFTKFVPRQALSRFLLKADMFRQVLDIQGSIVECGVFGGSGLMTWAQLSAIFEPLNHQRRIIGFDTFDGFTEISPEDTTGNMDWTYTGALAMDSYEDLLECIRIYDSNRVLGNIPKVALVKGDMKETVSLYLEEHPATIISLLYLDVDVYEPTKVALEYFIPRMPRGAIVAFDKLNSTGYPAETVAVLDTIGVRDLRIQRFIYDTKISYAILDYGKYGRRYV